MDKKNAHNTLPLGISSWTDGEIYYTVSPSQYIFLYENSQNTYNGHMSGNPEIQNFTNSKGGSSNPWQLSQTRVATQEEKEWFIECKKQGTSIPLKEFLLKSESSKDIKVSYLTITGEIKTEVIKGPISNAHQLEGFKSLNWYITQ